MPYLANTENTPVTHDLYQKGINLPTYYDLEKEQIEFICLTIKQLLNA
jgi:dTDP-4-amino-4,6-dideoxygalactose transaminase